MTIRTRFAPSPTGSLHVGGARTALYCLLYARRHGGRFLLRIEDTDQARSSEEAALGILRDLAWLGIDWDEGPGRPETDAGPYYQSERLPIFAAAFDTLVNADLVYEAWDSREELDAMRKEAEAAKENFRYRRQPTTQAQVAAWRAEGRTPVLRFAAPQHPVHLHDDILGEVSLGADDLDDLVVRKADGFPTYHFAVVVDDHAMGVSLVLRGQEHLMNTHKHLGLYEAFGWDPPRHAHLPLIFNPGGSKMSKRDKAKAARQAARDAHKAGGHTDYAWLAEAAGRPLEEIARFVGKKHDDLGTAEAIAQALSVPLPMIEVMDFRAGGFLPEALVNYLALLGWSPGDDRELLTRDELIEAFDLERVNKTAARFDLDKLTWMNGEYLRAASIDRLVAAQDDYLAVVPTSPFHGVDLARRRELLVLYQPRISTLADLDVQAALFFAAPTTWEDKAVSKHLLKGGGLTLLETLVGPLSALDDWTPEPIVACLEGFAAAHDIKMGKVAQPLRIAVTGTSASPGIGETLALLGRDEVVARVRACVASLSDAL